MRAKITLRGFNPSARGAGRVLGELETAVMELLWREADLAVNQVEEKLLKHRQIAHTTVLTTLDRMYRKGYLARRKKGKAYTYSPRYTREEFEQGLAKEVLSALLSGQHDPVLSAFVDVISEDEEKLNRLEYLIKQKREEKK